MLSLCALKFHLFLFLALLLVMKKRWRAIEGGACGLAVHGAAQFGGNPSMDQVLRDPWISPNPQDLPNLHGLILTLHGSFGVGPGGGRGGWYSVLGTCVLKSANFEFLVAVSLVCGLLASFHSGPADDVLLLTGFRADHRFLEGRDYANSDGSGRLAHSLSDGPSGSPYSAALPVLLIVWIVFAVRSIIGGVKFGVEKADFLRVSES